MSGITDELRSMAESIELTIPQAATLMMGAADAITELRGALQVASVDYRHLQAETDRLREERREYQATIDSLVDECTEHKAESDRLRELLQRTWDAFHDATAREFVTVKNELRELGVEVEHE